MSKKTKDGAKTNGDVVITPEAAATAVARIDAFEAKEKGKATRLPAMELAAALGYVLQAIPKKGPFAYVFCGMKDTLLTLRGGDEFASFESTCTVPPSWVVRGPVKRADAVRFVEWLKGHGPEANITSMDADGGGPGPLAVEIREREQPPGEYIVPRLVGAWKTRPSPTFRQPPLPGVYDCKRMGQAVKRAGLAASVRVADGGHLVYELRLGGAEPDGPAWHRAIIAPVGERVYDIEGLLVPSLDASVNGSGTVDL